MPAAASRQTGLKRLAAALAFLCLVLFLLAIEQKQTVAALMTATLARVVEEVNAYRPTGAPMGAPASSSPPAGGIAHSPRQA